MIDIVKMFWYNKIERKQGDKMKTLYLDRKKNGAVLVDGNIAYNLNSLNCAFGDVLSMLEETFPDKIFRHPEGVVKHFKDMFNGNDKSENIWGWSINGTILVSIYDVLSDAENLTLTLHDMEELRIKHFTTLSYLPINITNIDDGIKFENLEKPFHLIYGLLYYYAYYNLKLVKCQHCGRWFATTSFKNKYCPRKSTFNGYTHLNCEQAVRNIKQELARKKKRIYNKLVSYGFVYDGESPSNQFLNDCFEYKSKIDNKSSVENLSEYWDFLENYKAGENNGNDK